MLPRQSKRWPVDVMKLVVGQLVFVYHVVLEFKLVESVEKDLFFLTCDRCGWRFKGSVAVREGRADGTFGGRDGVVVEKFSSELVGKNIKLSFTRNVGKICVGVLMTFDVARC